MTDDITPEQMKKLPDDFTLYACETCGCSVFALDQDTLEDGGTSTIACCLKCGHTFGV